MKSYRELAEFVVSNGRVLANDDGVFYWDSLENEIEFEAGERGWTADEVHDAIEWAWNAMEHDGR